MGGPKDHRDIVDKLRAYSPNSGYSRIMREAADEIEKLRKKIEEEHQYQLALAEKRRGFYYWG